MGMKLGPLLERARTVQREQEDEARAAYRSPPVPFAPKPPPRGWLDLEGDIDELFAPLTSRAYEIDDAFELARAQRRADRREQYRLSDGLSLKQVKARREALVELRLLAGCCARCSNKRAPGNKRLCAVHHAREQERVQRRLLAGLCARCSNERAPHSKRFCADHLKRESKYQSDRVIRLRAAGTDPLISMKRAMVKCRKNAARAGRCRNLCGRAIRKTPRKRGTQPPVLCEPCAEAMRNRHQRLALARKLLRDEAQKAGLCRMLCGRRIRKTKLLRSKKPPVYCEECARRQRDRTALYLARRKRERTAQGQDAWEGP